MIQILGAVLVTGGVSWLGFWAARSLDREWIDLRTAEEALAILEREMEWDSPPLPELLKRLVRQCSGPMKGIFQSLLHSMDRLGEVTLAENWSESIEKERGFNREIKDALLPLGGVLGRYSCQEQLQAVARVRVRLEGIEQELLEKRQQKGKLYRVLGVSGGGFLALLLL